MDTFQLNGSASNGRLIAGPVSEQLDRIFLYRHNKLEKKLTFLNCSQET